MKNYLQFLQAKAALAPETGLPCELSDVNSILKPHQADIVVWAVRGGRRAIFAAFGLGKSVIQLEILRIVLSKLGGGKALVVAPLGVRQEFKRDAALLGQSIQFVRRTEEVAGDGLYITNYESVRDGRLDPSKFAAVSLDEAACLRGFGGSKTFREFMRHFEYSGAYRFVATATPSPNEYIELLAYAAFLDIMDVGQGKTRFFKRDSEKADRLTILPHKAEEFWLWVSTWAMFIQRPSDLGYSDEGYDLPPLVVNWHEVASQPDGWDAERWGQGKLFRNTKLNLMDAAREKRDSLPTRVAKMREIVSASPSDHFLLWHDLEAERHAIEKALPSVTSVYGAQDLDKREQSIIAFSEGRIPLLAAKPVMCGSGCNFQRHCHRAIFLGIGFKFADFIQAIHRIQRFLQSEPVVIDLIYTEDEREVKKALETKWEQHRKLTQRMTDIIKKYSLTQNLHDALRRSIGVERVEVAGANYRYINNDTVLETASMADNSVGLIVTSIPFSTQYEYTPSFNDFGHTDSNAHFWEQMDFLIPHLLRVLQPGRVAAIHVKDRIVPGGINGLGFQTVYPFSDDCIKAFQKHGFALLGRKTIVTDVVRENNQTYRLGWSEQCKDGSRMGAGMPEYVLLFRKPPTDASVGRADLPVVKEKPLMVDPDGNHVPFDKDKSWPIVPGTGYSRSRWQIDAHGFMRSSGNRLITPEELEHLEHDQIFRLFRTFNLSTVYDFEHHVKLGEALEARGQLPVTFMLLQPQSWHPDVWSDVTRMRTLNLMQSQKGQDMHLCPMQFDIADRIIAQMSMEGEVVYDPFGGLGTVPYRAIKLRRRGLGVELNPAYFLDACGYLKAEELAMATPSLFDLDEPEPLESAELEAVK